MKKKRALSGSRHSSYLEEIEVGDEGRVYGSRYYTAKPIFSFGSGWYNQHWNDMIAWCVDTFGPTPEDGVWTPGARWYSNNATFWFRAEEDLTLFLLKWQ